MEGIEVYENGFTNQSVLYIHNCDTNNAGQIFYLNMFFDRY